MAETQLKVLTLSSIFQMMENGNISTPSFGRGFVWTADLVKGLFESVNKGYPIGMILAVEAETDQFVQLSPIRSYFPDSESRGFVPGNTLWILDGSQRLAALYSVLRGSQKAYELHYDLREKQF